MGAAIEQFVHAGFAEEQIALNTVPAVHASGLFVSMACIRFGVPMILVERFDADAVLDAIQTHRCSWLVCMPFMIAGLMSRQRSRPRRVSSLRICLSGGDACPVQFQLEFPGIFGVALGALWAASEAVGSLIHGLEPGPVSRIAPGAEVRLIDDDGLPVRRGEVGELLVRGPNVTVGYWTGAAAIGARHHQRLVPHR